MLFSKQTVGNAGMYYVCYELSRRGWNAMPTSRNTRGIDILIYNHDASKKYTIQVKSLSKVNPVPLGKSLDHLFGDFFIICGNLEQSPEVYILPVDEIRDGILARPRNDPNPTSYWLPIKNYIQSKDNWNIIGNGRE